jgi:hypothetical protein
VTFVLTPGAVQRISSLLPQAGAAEREFKRLGDQLEATKQKLPSLCALR